MHQSRLLRNGFYVRTEPTADGLFNQAEGNLESDVAIIGDTCATRGCSLRCIDSVERAGSAVRQVICVFDRGHGGERIRALGYDCSYALRLVDGVPKLPMGLYRDGE